VRKASSPPNLQWWFATGDVGRVGQGGNSACRLAASGEAAAGHRPEPGVGQTTARVRSLIGNTLGFTNKSLRAQVSMLLGAPYRMIQMSYDLARLSRKGLIRRIPRSNTYTLTPDGVRIAMFYTKVHDRLVAPLCAADQAPAPTELRHALRTILTHVDAYIDRARLRKAAQENQDERRRVGNQGSPERLRRDPDPVTDIDEFQVPRAARGGHTGQEPSCVVSLR
jgi:hypothetical protein